MGIKIFEWSQMNQKLPGSFLEVAIFDALKYSEHTSRKA